MTSELRLVGSLGRVAVGASRLLRRAPVPPDCSPVMVSPVMVSPVMVLPGYGTTDAATFVLRRFLTMRGFQAVGWGLGRNWGATKKLMPRVRAALERLYEDHATPVQIVGWSMGGVFARELARDIPAMVRSVVTLGTPVVGGPMHTAFGPMYQRRGQDLEAIAARVAQREARALARPVSALYSKHDGVVAWQACLDPHNAQVRHVEASCTHLGFVLDPRAFELIAAELKDPARN